MHTMTCIRRTDKFTDWLCPICGRYLVVKLHPFHIEVIQAGDVTAGHSGMNTDGIVKIIQE